MPLSLPWEGLSSAAYHAPLQAGSTQTVSYLGLSRLQTKAQLPGLGFHTTPKASNWLNVAGMVCTVSLLISFLALPVEKTSRHYLTVCFIVAVCIMQVRRVRPLGYES